ncbi:hypothetical protein HL667_10670 [Bradyrhizobium sp. 83012]|uniref:Uncharacterized protein n=1 Tax=Bradyrhizobium aeschynomenes TaxID=2734909 RepID=A0ABX2CB48_9BRAD|nr:hypothetical protein [Bradyrhizobium aeschynomenes]NPU65456.1 hypothetical protein [Bradyrhizobium aeschynomenes]
MAPDRSCRLRHHPTGEYNGHQVLHQFEKPTHEAFVVNGEGKNAFWTKLGAAWPHDDGKVFNVPRTGSVLRICDNIGEFGVATKSPGKADYDPRWQGGAECRKRCCMIGAWSQYGVL